MTSVLKSCVFWVAVRFPHRAYASVTKAINAVWPGFRGA